MKIKNDYYKILIKVIITKKKHENETNRNQL